VNGAAPVRGLHHIALRVADVERALAFYAGVLGLTERRRFEEPDGRLRSVWLQAGTLVLMLEQRLRGAGPEAGSGHVLAFAVGELASWEARLAAAGVAIDDRTAHTLFVRDPDGHRVGLSVFELEASVIP
jgi:glyoxylase I family protein